MLEQNMPWRVNVKIHYRLVIEAVSFEYAIRRIVKQKYLQARYIHVGDWLELFCAVVV